MNLEACESALRTAGFQVRCWRDKRLYLIGYGRDIQAWIEHDDARIDADALRISTTWRSRHAAARCKSVKHAILCDLYAAGLLAKAPPDHWRDLSLPSRTPATRTPVAAIETMPWPFDVAR